MEYIEKTIHKTEDQNLIRNPQYHKIVEAINSLVRNQDRSSFIGNCVATCDIVQTILSQFGISSKIVECQVCVITNVDGAKGYMFVGYDNYSYPGQIDTHTVVVTEDENPILIDISLGNLLPPEYQFIIERIKVPESNSTGKEIISQINLKNVEITYFTKKNLKLSNIHQKNLVQRIVKEQKLDSTINFVKTMLYCSLTLSVINFILNMALIVLKLNMG